MTSPEAILDTIKSSLKSVPAPFLVLGALGAYSVVSFVLQALNAFYRFFLRPGKNLKKFGSYAVVTGATDGIGKAYAFEFARQGLNVVLISRTESKLKEVKEEIEKKYKNVKVSTVAVDYGNFDETARLKVSMALKGLDIAVLVNNVGQSYNFPVYFDELTDEQVKSLLELNVTSTVYMTRLVLPGMVERKKGAIVNLSSAAAKNPSPLLAEYSGAKSFIELFSQSLNSEYRHKGICVQVQTPLFVATKLAKIRKTSLTVPSPSGYARAAVKFIGYEDSISPYWSHALQLYIMSLLPPVLLNKIVFDMHAGLRKAGLKKAAKTT